MKAQDAKENILKVCSPEVDPALRDMFLPYFSREEYNRHAVVRTDITAVHLAAGMDDLDTLKECKASLGWDVNAQDNNELTPLYMAAFYGQVKAVEWLISNGADINRKKEIFKPYSKKETYCDVNPLLLAALNNKPKVVGLLIDLNANRLVRDQSNKTALHYVVLHEDIKNVERLLDDPATSQKLLDVVSILQHESALNLAALKGYTEILKILIKHDIKRKVYKAMNGLGITPLGDALATMEGKSVDDILTIVKILLTEYDYKKKPWNYYSPLAALRQPRPTNGIVRESHTTLLLTAVGLESEELVKLLLDQKANPNKGRHWYPISFAASKGNCNILNLLIQHNPNQIYLSDTDGNRAIHYAAQHGHEPVLQLLLDEDLKLKNSLRTVKNKEGENPLQVAINNNHLPIVKKLVNTKVGSDLFEKKTKNGETPLLIAAKLGYVEIFQYLIEQGADCIKDSAPLREAARTSRGKAIANLLEDTIANQHGSQEKTHSEGNDEAARMKSTKSFFSKQ